MTAPHDYLWVSGPHSSGTRLVKRMVEASGVQNVRHCTYPTGSWNWGIGLVWVSRNPWITMKSQVARKYGRTYEEAQDNITDAWYALEVGMQAHPVPILYVQYEAILQNEVRELERMYDWLSAIGQNPDPDMAKLMFDEEIVDGNAKYRVTSPP